MICVKDDPAKLKLTSENGIQVMYNASIGFLPDDHFRA